MSATPRGESEPLSGGHTALPHPDPAIQSRLYVYNAEDQAESRDDSHLGSCQPRSIPTLTLPAVARVQATRASPHRLRHSIFGFSQSGIVRPYSAFTQAFATPSQHIFHGTSSLQRFHSHSGRVPLITPRISTYDPAGLSEMNVLSHGDKLGVLA